MSMMIQDKVRRRGMTKTVRQFYQMYTNNQLNFDNAVQRSFVWDDDRKSLFIHSLIVGFFCSHILIRMSDEEKEIYDVLEGKQRGMTMCTFIENEFKLQNVPPVEYVDGDEWGELNINGKTYAELPECVREKLNDAVLDLVYFEKISDDDVAEQFYRTNNGKPLTSIELSRVKSKALSDIQEIAKHDIFSNALTAKMLERYVPLELIVKCYITLNKPEEPNLESKYWRPFLEKDLHITKEDKDQFKAIFDFMMEVHGKIEDKKIAKRMFGKTHLVTIFPFFWKAIEEKRTAEDMAKWFSAFFGGKRSATISTIYNENAKGGTGKVNSVKKRMREVEMHYVQYFKKKDKNAAA